MPEPKPEEPISYPERVARLVAARKWPDIAAQSGVQFAAHVALVRSAVNEVLAAEAEMRAAHWPVSERLDELAPPRTVCPHCGR